MPAQHSLLLRIGTLFLTSCAILNAGDHRRSSSGTSRTHHSSNSTSTRSHRSTYCARCARDSRGRIKRNPEAVREFRSNHPCPSTGSTRGGCPGYVVDHTKALKHGGSDTPGNMEWQTREAAKAKDRTE
jgi:hypothetical protein